nr:MAG TPA: restriction alleviation protein [Bacteriophage sp.]
MGVAHGTVLGASQVPFCRFCGAKTASSRRFIMPIWYFR